MLKNALLCLALSTLTISAYSQQNYRQMGFDAYQAGDYRKAVEYLAKAVEENEGDKSAWLYLGASYVNLGKTSDARRTFNHWRKVKAMPGDNEPLTDEPLKITRNSAPTINEELRRSAIRPQARLLVEFKSDGKVGFVFILGNTTPEWERDVIDAAKRFRFEPAAKNGVPVTIVRLVEFDGPI
ncbi:MAG TPA: tetratricopeptide repeat protein [Pyrinomonadaceae bacterium]|nr:tetratricopeptide repeat protein [Pyrinomonadaceae bacterium]HMP66967.1 tetratricopeptide repeat protein [Pyrinomonadaceae bacterium]